MDSVVCYVCNEKADEWQRNLGKLKSRHSNDSIGFFVKKLLLNIRSQRNVDDESNCICVNCLQRIEEYDWACKVAERYKKDLLQILLKTETFYDNKPNLSRIEEINLPIDYENPFEEDVERSSISDEKPEDDEEAFDQTSDIKIETQNGEVSDGDYDFAIDDSNQSDSDSDDEFLASIKKRHSSKSTATKSEEKKVYRNDPYECDECGEALLTKKKLLAHMRWHRDQNLPQFKCQQCFVILEDQISYDDHLKLHENRAPLECFVCGKVLSKKSNLHKHMKIHAVKGENHENVMANGSQRYQSYKCSECDEIFPTRKDFSKHESWHREQNEPEFKCQKCFVILEDQTSYDDHVKLHENKAPLECVICGVRIKSKKSNLHIHMRLHTNIWAKNAINSSQTAKVPFKIQNVWPTKPPVKPIIKPRTREGGPSYACNECDETFPIKSDLKVHRRVHNQEKIPEFRCGKCYLVLDDEISFEHHFKLHNDKPPLECVICDKRLSKKSNLHKHMNIHANKRNYQCQICGKSFIHYSSFTEHMKYHINDRNVACEHCPLRFVSKQGLRKHMVIHTLKELYECSICQRKFRHRHNMREHEKLHTESDKKHNCSFCSESFARRSKLNQHMERNHSTVPVATQSFTENSV